MKKRFAQASVRTIAEDVEKTRYIEFVASDNSRDSYKTVLPVNKWNLDRFNANPVIGYQHALYYSTNPDMVIGTGKAFIEGDQLIIGITFEPGDLNPLADKLFRKVVHGTIKAVSVGFDPIKDGNWGQGEEAYGKSNQTYYYDGQELLEVSIVHIPGNKNALKRLLETQGENLSQENLQLIKRILDDSSEGTEEPNNSTEDAPNNDSIDEQVRKIEQEITIAEAEALSFQIK